MDNILLWILKVNSYLFDSIQSLINSFIMEFFIYLYVIKFYSLWLCNILIGLVWVLKSSDTINVAYIILQ